MDQKLLQNPDQKGQNGPKTSTKPLHNLYVTKNHQKLYFYRGFLTFWALSYVEVM